MKKVSLVVVGAGSRGFAYANYARACPEEAEVVAVCEPRPEWRERMAREHNIPAENCFDDWKALLDRRAGPER